MYRLSQAWQLCVDRLGFPCMGVLAFLVIVGIVCVVLTRRNAYDEEQAKLMFVLGLEEYQFLKRFGRRVYEGVHKCDLDKKVEKFLKEH